MVCDICEEEVRRRPYLDLPRGAGQRCQECALRIGFNAEQLAWEMFRPGPSNFVELALESWHPEEVSLAQELLQRLIAEEEEEAV